MTTADLSGELAKKLHATTDAAVWTNEFCRLFPESDWGLMVGWFANAIEVGRDHGARTIEAAEERDNLQGALDAALTMVRTLEAAHHEWTPDEWRALKRDRGALRQALDRLEVGRS